MQEKHNATGFFLVKDPANAIPIYMVSFLVISGMVAIGGASSDCTSADDCSLNGICANGRCVCDPEWLGPRCEWLNLLPTHRDHGYQPVNSSSWGGSLVRDPADGRIHMFAARITNNCGLTTWKTNSEIVHLTSESPLGPFQPEAPEPVVPRFSHNPVIHKNAEGRYLLYHIGCGSSPENCPNCARCVNGTTPKGSVSPNRSNVACDGPHWTGLLTSTSLAGPWRDEGEVVLNTSKALDWITNPCVVPAGQPGDGSVAHLLYRQPSAAFLNATSDGGERLGWAIGESCPSTINCTYTDLSPYAPVLDCNLEDQYLWRDHRENWHALTHKNCRGAGVSGHMWSGDGGMTWKTSTVSPYNNTIVYQDGGVQECGKRARPMLLVEDGRPRFLSTGASYNKHTDHTFTTMQEVAGGRDPPRWVN